MLFNVWRILLWLILSIFLIIRIKKSKIVRKKIISLISVVLSLILISASGMFPIENLFISFKSPEDLFNYVGFGKINDVVYGKDSCMIIYSEGSNTVGKLIVPMSKEGYKIPNYFEMRKVLNKLGQYVHVDVYNALGTNDYYIFGTVVSKENEINITDKNDQPVKNIAIGMGNSDMNTIFIYSYTQDFTDSYYLIVNENKVFLN